MKLTYWATEFYGLLSMTGPDMMLFDVQELLYVQYYMMYVYMMVFEISHICNVYMSTCTDLQPLFLTACSYLHLMLKEQWGSVNSIKPLIAYLSRTANFSPFEKDFDHHFEACCVLVKEKRMISGNLNHFSNVFL